MGSLYFDFINQLTAPTPEESEETLQLICECSRGELRFDGLESQEFSAIENCNIRGICAYVAKNKHMAKISSKYNEITKKFEERVNNRKLTQKPTKSETIEENEDELRIKSKSLLTFI
ncbi:MAG: hypothetical protein ACW981_01845 [Candidatus Hodarchaeales archaeon]|jgi:hypothetical protein